MLQQGHATWPSGHSELSLVQVQALAASRWPGRMEDWWWASGWAPHPCAAGAGHAFLSGTLDGRAGGGGQERKPILVLWAQGDGPVVSSRPSSSHWGFSLPFSLSLGCSQGPSLGWKVWWSCQSHGWPSKLSWFLDALFTVQLAASNYHYAIIPQIIATESLCPE